MYIHCVAEQAPRLHRSVALNVREGLVMAIGTLPSIMSVGLLSLLLAVPAGYLALALSGG